jgi:uncharacterized protein involved in response to NO
MPMKKEHEMRNFWNTFTAAPHRMMFFGGAFQVVATIVWWLTDLGGRFGGLYAPIVWTIPPIWAHLFLMLYGVFPFFIFGFLMTTYPNWMNGKKIPPSLYVPAFIGLFAGVLLFYAGLAVGRNLLILAVVLILTGWTFALHALTQVLITAPSQDKQHPIFTNIALAFGWLGVLSYLLWLVTEDSNWLSFARHAGIWFFLLPILITVAHRMIPFFSSRVLQNYVVYRPNWALYVMLACALLHGVFDIAGQARLTWLADLPLLFLAANFSYRWKFFASFKVRLLAVLHVSYAWLSVALALYAAQSLALFVNDSRLFGLAPLHALGIGFIASMVMAMASRVTLGHAGRELVCDQPTWVMFLGFQTAALMRVLADTPGVAGTPTAYLYFCAGIVWLLCYTPWAVKYGRAYLRPREDGNVG